jgi:flagellar biosynthesis protein FlhF
MKMKKYTADTMVEAMKKVRADFGDDAIILSSNVVTSKGFLGFFQKKSVEVVAGFDQPETVLEEPTYIPKWEPESTELQQDAEIRKEIGEMKRLLQEMKKFSL